MESDAFSSPTLMLLEGCASGVQSLASAERGLLCGQNTSHAPGACSSLSSAHCLEGLDGQVVDTLLSGEALEPIPRGI